MWSTTQTVWKASRAKASESRLDRSERAGNTALGIGPKFPTPSPTADVGDSSLNIKLPHPLQPIHGILRSPQVVYTRKCKVLHRRVILIALVVTCPICILDTHYIPILLAQVFRPLWPFFAASGITYFLVSKAQDIGVRCESFHLSEKASSRPRSFSPSFSAILPL
jgi:hypothetical protein